MLELEEQLQRYAEHFDQRLLSEPSGTPASRAGLGPRSGLLLLAVVVTAAIVASLILLRGRDGTHVATAPAPIPANGGVFSSATGTVLLFADGIDGVTAIDLDQRIAARRVIEGERAGDQPFRLTVTGGRLVVGWGEIYAAPLTGGPSTKVDDATIYIPASEPGEVWTLAWDGGAMGVGTSILRRVRVDGTVTYSSAAFAASGAQALLGVPGGLVVQTDDGIHVWSAASEALGPVLGPGPATDVSSDGRTLVWCAATCAETHRVTLAETGPAPAPHVSPLRHIALSPDGQTLAVLRPATVGTDLVVIDTATGAETITAQTLDPALGALMWTEDSSQLFYVEYSYQQSMTRIGRYLRATGDWELQRINVGGSTGAVPLPNAQAAGLFADAKVIDQDDCPDAGNTFPSGRAGACAFRFSALN